MLDDDNKMVGLFFLAYFGHQAAIFIGGWTMHFTGVYAGAFVELFLSLCIGVVWVFLFRRWFELRGDQ